MEGEEGKPGKGKIMIDIDINNEVCDKRAAGMIISILILFESK